MPYAQTRNALKQCLRIKKEDDEIEKISSPPLEIYFSFATDIVVAYNLMGAGINRPEYFVPVF